MFYICSFYIFFPYSFFSGFILTSHEFLNSILSFLWTFLLYLLDINLLLVIVEISKLIYCSLPFFKQGKELELVCFVYFSPGFFCYNCQIFYFSVSNKTHKALSLLLLSISSLYVHLYIYHFRAEDSFL